MPGSAFTPALQKLYIACFKRPADTAGLAYWEEAAANGTSLADIAAAFANSAEYHDLCAGMSHAQVVNTLYQNLFGRNAEAGGLAFWTGLLDKGTLTMANLPTAMMNGAQGGDITALANKTAAAQAFTAALDTPDKSAAYTGPAIDIARAWLAAVSHTTASTVDSEATLSNTLAKALDAGRGILHVTVVDGYIGGATVFADANGNGKWDADEAKAVTDTYGKATLTKAHGLLIVTGGSDLSTGAPLKGMLTATAGASVISPLTTLRQALLAQGQGMEQAQATLARAFGLDLARIDLDQYDPLAISFSTTASAADKAIAVQVQGAALKAQGVIVAASNALIGAAGNTAPSGAEAATKVVNAMAQLIQKDADGIVDLADTGVLQNVLTGAASQFHDGSLSIAVGNIAAAFATILAGSAQRIDAFVAAGSASDQALAQARIAQVGMATQGIVAERIGTAAASGTLDGVMASLTGNALAVLVSASRIGDLVPGSEDAAALATANPLPVNSTPEPDPVLSTIAPADEANALATQFNRTLDAADNTWSATAIQMTQALTAGLKFNAGDAITVTAITDETAALTQYTLTNMGGSSVTLDAADTAWVINVATFNAARTAGILFASGNTTTIADTGANISTSLTGPITGNAIVKITDAASVTLAAPIFSPTSFDLSAATAQVLTLAAGYTGATSVKLEGDGGGHDTINNSGANVALTVTGNVLDFNATTITGGTGTDTLQLTANSDTASLANVIGVETVTILANTTDATKTATLTGLTTAAGKTVAVDASALTSSAAAFSFTAGADAGHFSITGGAGADTIVAGNGGDTIAGGAGNDSITAGTGIDSIHGGNDDDTIVFAATNDFTAADTVDGGAGTDTLVTTIAAHTNLAATLTTISNVEKLQISDALSGATLNMARYGAAGPATVVLAAAAGNSAISNLLASSTIEQRTASAGTTLTATAASDTGADALTVKLNAAATADFGTLTAASFETFTINSTTTNSTPSGVANTLVLDTTNGTDIAVTGNTALVLATSSAAVSVRSIDASGMTEGGVSADNTRSNVAATLTGSSFADTLYGGAGADTIQGGDGNDLIYTSAGADVIDGGNGTADTLKITSGATGNLTGYTLSNFETLDLNTVAATLNVAEFSGFSAFSNASQGVTFSDAGTITAATANLSKYTLANGVNTFTGNGNLIYNVTAAASSAAQTFNFLGSFLNSSDTIVGGSGTADVLNITGNSGMASTSLSGIDKFETINFSNTTTSISINRTGLSTLSASSGVLTFNATSQTTGSFTFIDDATSAQAMKFMLGGTGNGTITIAGNEAVTIIGGAGNDVFTTNAAVDSIVGGTGNDTVNAGVGADLIDLSAGGTDSWRINVTNAGDIITGFKAGAASGFDLIDWMGSLISNNGTSVSTNGFGASSPIGSSHVLVLDAAASSGATVTIANATGYLANTNAVFIVNSAVGTLSANTAADFRSVFGSGGSHAITTNGNDQGKFLVVAYDGTTAAANACLFLVDVSTTAGGVKTIEAGDTVTLLGVLNGIGADTLVAGNFR